jgi:site-specific DNA recombinase
LLFTALITQANEAIRQLIKRIRLVPEGNTLNIELFGELAALISLGIEPNDKHPLANAEGVQVTLVAGAGFEPATFRL